MDTEELVNKCRAIKIREDEENSLVIQGACRITGIRMRAQCLVGKVLSTKLINQMAFKRAITQIWKTIQGVRVESLGNNIFIFQFSLHADKRRVMEMGPWHFDKSLLVFSEIDGIGEVAKMKFSHVSFWIQIHNLPILCMNKEVALLLGSRVGQVEEVEEAEEGGCMGTLLRIRVKVDITKPLKKYIKVQMQESLDEVTLPIQYEKLPEFCFKCGRVGHVNRECEEPTTEIQGTGSMEEYAYGKWMRATTKGRKEKAFLGQGKQQDSQKSREERAQPVLTQTIGDAASKGSQDSGQEDNTRFISDDQISGMEGCHNIINMDVIEGGGWTAAPTSQEGNIINADRGMDQGNHLEGKSLQTITNREAGPKEGVGPGVGVAQGKTEKESDPPAHNAKWMGTASGVLEVMLIGQSKEKGKEPHTDVKPGKWKRRYRSRGDPMQYGAEDRRKRGRETEGEVKEKGKWPKLGQAREGEGIDTGRRSSYIVGEGVIRKQGGQVQQGGEENPNAEDEETAVAGTQPRPVQ